MAQIPEQVASKLKQANSEIKKSSGGLADHELLKIKEKRAILVDKLQKKYGHRQKTTPPTE